MTIEEKRRELFEAWAITEAKAREYPFMSRVTARHADDSYATLWVDSAWLGFNAALDAVVIKLPERDTSSAGGFDSEMGPSYEQVEGCGYNYALDDCRAAIESTSLGLKVKL